MDYEEEEHRSQSGLKTFIVLLAILVIVWLIPMMNPPLIRYNETGFGDSCKPITQQELIGIGKNNTNHDSLISAVKKDLNLPKDYEIKIFNGPYISLLGPAVIIQGNHIRGSVLFIDNNFYNTLNSEEREAIVAHELGHLINKPTFMSDKEIRIRFQVEADTYATKYVNPEVLIKVLDKLFWEYTLRIKNLEKLQEQQNRQ